MGLVKGVEPYIKPKPKVEVPRADNFVFRLHYRVRSCFMLIYYRSSKSYYIKHLIPSRTDMYWIFTSFQATFAFLAVASILVSSYAYIDSKGSNIQCMINKVSNAMQSNVNSDT